MKNVKFRGKTPIPRLGSKFRGPRQIVGPSDNILTLATSAQCRAEKPHYLSGNLPTSAARRGKPTTVPRAKLPTSTAPRGKPTTVPRENLPTSAARRGKPTTAPRANLPNSRCAPNNEMSLQVTQHNYVDDIGHRAPDRAITCHFLNTP